MKKKIYNKFKYDFIGPPVFDTRNIRFEQVPPRVWESEKAQEYRVYIKDTESQHSFILRRELQLIRNSTTGEIEFHLNPLLADSLYMLTDGAVLPLMKFKTAESGFYYIEKHLDKTKVDSFIQEKFKLYGINL